MAAVAAVVASGGRSELASIHWFRKGLRLRDNPALVEACSKASTAVYPVFILDPKFTSSDIMSANRFQFLVESLQDLDAGLRQLGTRLFVVRGKPEEQFPQLIKKWDVSLVTLESDKTGPYSVQRDAKVLSELHKSGVRISQHCSHTLWEADRYLAASRGSAPKSYQSFCKLFDSLGPPRAPCAAPARCDMPPAPHQQQQQQLEAPEYAVPTLEEMRTLCGRAIGDASSHFKGGETEALKRLHDTVLMRPAWAAAFQKPDTPPNSLLPSTTVLSPYISMGCLSASTLYHALDAIYRQHKHHAQPPVSLHGQILWREWFYLCAATTPNFAKMEGNPSCKQIPWERDRAKIEAWKNAQTGYPFIDAIMTQLRLEGWIHHLARHAVACFLTRGDLWQHWEEGIKVFELWLLDGDHALNAANWQWLSCSRFFHQYGRCYSPVAFGKKTDPDGSYIKKYLPALAKMPSKYIYEPWTAPIEVQRAAGCIIGTDYPRPIVDHATASKRNMDRLSAAYAAAKAQGDDGDDGEGGGGAKVAGGGGKTAGAKASSAKAGGAGTGTGGQTQSIAPFFSTTTTSKKRKAENTQT